ncbi:MAG: NnrS family protein [Flavobacteriaceae bacterium]
MPLPRHAPYTGPALFSAGFRPFFLLGSLQAGLSVFLWLSVHQGWLNLDPAIPPVEWHIHEMLYGYLPAALTGFLLTAIPNWTGRLPVQGWPLAALAMLWLAGRALMLAPSGTDWRIVAAVDCAFLLAVALVALREIAAGRNWRNLRVLLPLAVLSAGNAVFHLEVAGGGFSDYGRRIGFAAAIILISLIGGRIIPSFTRNWLVRQNATALPSAFGRFDALTIAFSAAAMLLWIAIPDARATAAAFMFAALLQAGRLARWQGLRAWRDPLVLILHASYLMVPAGFALLGAAMLWPGAISSAAGLHAFGAGAIGVMTIAVMTRASLGHTGHALAAGTATRIIYAAIVLAAVTRIGASLTAGGGTGLLIFSASAWSAGYLLFALVYGRILVRPRSRG